jgi:hypothetical protein
MAQGNDQKHSRSIIDASVQGSRQKRIAMIRLWATVNNPSIKADLFSEQQSLDASSSSASEAKSSPLPDETAAASSQSYALPKNLSSALGYLDDDQLDRLLEAALAEQRRRRMRHSLNHSFAIAWIE